MNDLEQHAVKKPFSEFGIFLVGFLVVITLPLVVITLLQPPSSNRLQEAITFEQIPQKQIK